MADISQYLQDILDAVYGEEVRGSIHDAINIINKVSEKVMGVGTDISSTSSPVVGYYKDSLYLNTDTDDLWKCTGTAWEKEGNVKGDKGDTGAKCYMFVRYSQYPDGTDFHTPATDADKYLGIYGGDQSTAPTDKTAYSWQYTGLDVQTPIVQINWDTGELEYSGGNVILSVDTDGYLIWERD